MERTGGGEAQAAIEARKGLGEKVTAENDPMPRLYSDNGSGLTSKPLAEYISEHGTKHIFGTPYHPQGRGKIDRFNRRIKEKLCLVV